MSIFKYIHPALQWLWSHRTKLIGGLGLGAGYVASHQAQIGVFIPAAELGHWMIAIGVVTFLVGLYNTLTAP